MLFKHRPRALAVNELSVSWLRRRSRCNPSQRQRCCRWRSAWGGRCSQEASLAIGDPISLLLPSPLHPSLSPRPPLLISLDFCDPLLSSPQCLFDSWLTQKEELVRSIKTSNLKEPAETAACLRHLAVSLPEACLLTYVYILWNIFVVPGRLESTT